MTTPPRPSHPWAILDGDTPLFHTPGTFPPAYARDDALEQLWRAKRRTTMQQGIPAEYLNQIVTGDARVLAERIPDASVDLIFTDPVYDRIEDYAWLAETAARVLKPGGACLVWMGIQWIPEESAALATALTYRWQMIEYRPNEARPRHSPNGRSTYSSLTWWEKTKTIVRKKTVDVRVKIVMPLSVERVTFHGWGKSESTTAYYMTAFSLHGHTVFDPFSGGGTVPAVCKKMGRDYVAFEMDCTTAQHARARVEATQAMHPVFLEEQIPMFESEAA